MLAFSVPSRSRCRYLWTVGDYQGIAENFESNFLYRKLFVSGARKLDLESIYLTALLHLNREEEVLRFKDSILALRNAGQLAYRLELNKFSIDVLHLTPTREMSRAYEAMQAIERIQPIDVFWQKHCARQSVSVVGNGPVQTPHGSEIDASDIVIRFNTFLIAGYEASIGSKTDAWCHICDVRCDESIMPLYDGIPQVILTDNPLNIPVGEQFLHDVLDDKKSLYYIPQRLVTETASKLGSIPSSGARLLISLAENKEALRIHAKIYGFSFLSDHHNKNRFDHYYEEKQESKERAHNISNEVNLLRSLFAGSQGSF